MSTKYILFDAANTLIHKPALWENLLQVLEKNGHAIPPELLKKKITSSSAKACVSRTAPAANFINSSMRNCCIH